jgi:hypothetical protein
LASHPAFVFLAACAIVLLLRVPPTPLVPSVHEGEHYLTGDEPSYYLIATSLALDGDTDLSNNIAAEDWRRAGTTPTRGHSRPGAREGRYSMHRPGMPWLIFPAYVAGLRTALTPRGAVTLFINLLAAATALLMFFVSKRITGAPVASSISVLLLTATLPYVAYAGQAYPEMGAAACVAAILLALEAMPARWARWFAPLPIAFLPWLHERFSILAIAFGVLYLARSHRRWRDLLFLGFPCAAAWGSLALYFVRLYGTPWPDPGMHPSMGWNGGVGLLGLYLDAAHGLAPCNPAYLLAPLGAVLLLKDNPRRGIAFLAPAALYYLLMGFFHDWWGGFSPPGRYMVVLIPFTAPLLTLALKRRPLLFLLLGSLAIASAALAHALPELVYRHAHVVDRSFQFLAPGRFFPSWLQTPDNARLYALSFVWLTMTFGIAVRSGLGPAGGSRGLVAAPAFLFLGGIAAILVGEWANPVPSYRNDSSVLRLWTRHAARPDAPILTTGDRRATYFESGLLFEAEDALYPASVKPEDDELARNGRAVVARVTPPGRECVLLGQYAFLPRGTYEARYRVRVLPESPDVRVIFDVVGEGGRRDLARRDLTARDVEPDVYARVALPFELETACDRLEFRVHVEGAAKTWIDRVTVRRRWAGNPAPDHPSVTAPPQ